VFAYYYIHEGEILWILTLTIHDLMLALFFLATLCLILFYFFFF
jgi:hypothetical protein